MWCGTKFGKYAFYFIYLIYLHYFKYILLRLSANIQCRIDSPETEFIIFYTKQHFFVKYYQISHWKLQSHTDYIFFKAFRSIIFVHKIWKLIFYFHILKNPITPSYKSNGRSIMKYTGWVFGTSYTPPPKSPPRLKFRLFT